MSEPMLVPNNRAARTATAWPKQPPTHASPEALCTLSSGRSEFGS
eukprot:CAMPEP_0172758070 /NCGR_PEP_ID=MMETSP1074-20121228/165035_1 /TAXON_ID=2916 /ORGANISM="Ceratium fusus, Strain PA161109" /LENGTH=44 /DNA_ID= /DNA_START= /DNA_END= /DNA_ORIENTATION=